jgi:hypothetical protein
LIIGRWKIKFKITFRDWDRNGEIIDMVAMIGSRKNILIKEGNNK